MSLRKRVSKLEQNISHLMKLPDHRFGPLSKDYHHDLDKQIRTLFDNYNKLQKQIECGLAGHDFEITENVWSVCELGTMKTIGYRGRFRCRHCNISYTRDLTTQEVNAAKKLRLIAK